jgi:hypothetical protein
MGVIIPKDIYRVIDLKNILILADGSIARHFVDWVGRKRIAENKYYVTCYKADATPEKVGKNITLIHADPTSYSKMKKIMDDVKFSHVFIVMQELEDAKYALKNVRLIDQKVKVILVNQWDDDEIGRDEQNITLIDVDELIAAHLYDQLPNVPLVAQNVGLGKGEIMEIHVPFGSAYAYRHVGSILQRKWKIAAIYRDDKQILPTNATMIKPNDALLVVGKPMVLDGVYRAINKRIGLFPEPFGQDLYLILDFRYDQESALMQLRESIYLTEKLENKSLFVRIINPSNFDLIEQLKAMENERVTLFISYDEEDPHATIEYDIGEHDIGLVLSSIETFEGDGLKEILYNLKKLVYLFGDRPLYNIHESVILMGENEKMESISATAFDISESLGLKLSLCDFDPEGDFESKKMVIDHYETLSHIFNIDVHVEQKVANPLRELAKMENILQIAPFEKELSSAGIWKLLSTKVDNFLLRNKHHPKLLVPFALAEGREEG